jgi:hypothetical protein
MDDERQPDEPRKEQDEAADSERAPEELDRDPAYNPDDPGLKGLKGA